jgi:DNA-binding GntR family transcriptional regulator
MKVISTPPKLVTQVHQAIVAEIAQGRLRHGARIIQEQLAEQLGVSRQPVQQALLLLRNQGVLTDAPGRGLIVAPLDLVYVREMYEIRAVIEGLAFRRAAEHNAERMRKLGAALIADGRSAEASGSLASMIAADLRFHSVVHEMSKNRLIAPMMEAQWICTQRVMGEALMQAGRSREVWIQHEAMLEAVAAADGDRAEALAKAHIADAAAVVIERIGALPDEDGKRVRRAPEPAHGTLNSAVQSS